MKSFKTAIAIALIAALPGLSQAQEKVTVAWSVWTGWMPHKVMEVEGFLDQRNKEFGTNVELKEFKGYLDSVRAFTTENVDAVAMTSIESLQPASSGVRSVAVIANDISNGGDGLLVRNGMTIEDLRKNTVYLEQFSVSHYLAIRAGEENGISASEISIQNMPGDDVGKSFLTDDTIRAAVTWNPHLYLAQENQEGTVVFSSADIPGEVIDLSVFNAKIVETNPAAVRTYVAAYYDACRYIEDLGTRESAIAIMAEGAGTTPAEFNKMLGGTILFTKPEQTVTLFGSPKIISTMDRIKTFSLGNELITDAEFQFGYGKHDPSSKALLWFDPTFAQEVKAAADAQKPATE